MLKQKLKLTKIFYIQGNLRANYVDENRLFRTIVYVTNKKIGYKFIKYNNINWFTYF